MIRSQIYVMGPHWVDNAQSLLDYGSVLSALSIVARASASARAGNLTKENRDF